MEFIKSEDYRRGSEDLAKRIVSELIQGKKVLWLLTGGSSVSSSVEALRIIKENVRDLVNLAVTLTDERYGQVGHKDSSWQKLIDSGFDFSGLNALPVILGLSFEETAHEWERHVSEAFISSDIVIAQFGVGRDMHIAGILPASPATGDRGLVSYYRSGTFERITLTFEAIKHVNAAYVFIFGEPKREAVQELRVSDAPLDLKPANILKFLPEVFVYLDNV